MNGIGRLRIGVVQMNSGADVAGNLDSASQALREAAAEGAQLVVLPENFAAMGPDEAYRLSIAEADGSGPIQDFLAESAARLGVWIVGGTLPLTGSDPARPASSCLVFDAAGSRRARYDKIHLFDVGIPGARETYRESINTLPGQQPVCVDTPWGGLAVAVCYDLRFPEMFRRRSDRGYSVLALPAAFTHATGQAHWHTLLRARAVENLCFVAAAAQAGEHPGDRRTWGHSLIAGPWGDMLVEMQAGTGVVCADADLDEMRRLRERFPTLEHSRFTVRDPNDGQH